MQTYRPKVLALALVLALSSFSSFYPAVPVSAHGYHPDVISYVSWGIDEWELFGFTQAELASKFKGKLRFDKKFTHAWMGESSDGPQFILAADAAGRVMTVQRLFIDGAGCNLLGPKFVNKKDALEFASKGLAGMDSRDASDEKRLKDVNLLLAKTK
jgi:hypothetical protein